ncbi:MAG: hypothetical protein H7246_11635 [Phycisphaerae bacterium]|nr:hypothetical protein [Saprospiraceae bacterium]
MKKSSLCSLLILAFLEVHGQFSLGADLVGIGLTRASQNDIGLKLDSSLSSSRLVFSVNSNLVGAYKFKSWEFSLGIGHENYFWKQKFDAPTADVKSFVGSDSQSDSSDYLAKVTYSSKLMTLPIGAKYLWGQKSDSWANAFVAVRLMPSFAYHRSASAGFFDRPSFFLFPFRVRREEDPALDAATEAYFQPKANPFLLDGIAEIGCRLWGGRRKYAVDFSIGYLYGFIPLHEQMRSTKGLFGNLALRFFFKRNVVIYGLI